MSGSYRKSGGGGSRRTSDRDESDQKKHTGSTEGQDKHGNHYVRGFNYQRGQGLRTFIASKSKSGKGSGRSGSGKEWERYTVWIQHRDGSKNAVTGFWYPQEKKLRMPDVNMVASVKQNYWGKMFSADGYK